MTTLEQPVRYPDLSSRSVMTRRGWWLIALNVLIPGSAQVLAGSRRLGRFGLVTTFLLWALAVAAVLLWFLNRGVLVWLVTTPAALGAGIAVLAFYAAVWVILTLDTLRLVRLVRVAPRARGWMAAISVVVLSVLVAASGFTGERAATAMSVLGTVFGSSAPLADPIDGRYNILVLGGDAGADRTGLRPDSISVVSVDANTGAIVMLGVPRNLEFAPFVTGSPLWGPYPQGYACGDDCLVSYLYTYGQEHPDLYPDAEKQGATPGVLATRDAVEGVLGITLQYYVLIDMGGFEKLINALGGVTIDVDERLPVEGGQAPDGTPIDVKEWIEPGLQKLDGYHALWYARSRHSTDDYDRMRRQRILEQAILAQMDPANVLLHFDEIAAAGKQIVKTDIPQGMLSHFADLALQAKQQPVVTQNFVPPDYEPWHPDFAAIQKKVHALLHPKPTSTPTPTGN